MNPQALKQIFIHKMMALGLLLKLPIDASAVEVAAIKSLAESGNLSAQFNLGLMYDDGQRVHQSFTLAFKWYERAANKGDADAQTKLGLMYKNGKGMLQDVVIAAAWYEKAAKSRSY